MKLLVCVSIFWGTLCIFATVIYFTFTLSLNPSKSKISTKSPEKSKSKSEIFTFTLRLNPSKNENFTFTFYFFQDSWWKSLLLRCKKKHFIENQRNLIQMDRNFIEKTKFH